MNASYQFHWNLEKSVAFCQKMPEIPNILYKRHYACLNSFKNVQGRGSRKGSSCFLVLILGGHGREQSHEH